MITATPHYVGCRNIVNLIQFSQDDGGRLPLLGAVLLSAPLSLADFVAALTFVVKRSMVRRMIIVQPIMTYSCSSSHRDPMTSMLAWSAPPLMKIRANYAADWSGRRLWAKRTCFLSRSSPCFMRFYPPSCAVHVSYAHRDAACTHVTTCYFNCSFYDQHHQYHAVALSRLLFRSWRQVPWIHRCRFHPYEGLATGSRTRGKQGTKTPSWATYSRAGLTGRRGRPGRLLPALVRRLHLSCAGYFPAGGNHVSPWQETGSGRSGAKKADRASEPVILGRAGGAAGRRQRGTEWVGRLAGA